MSTPLKKFTVTTHIEAQTQEQAQAVRDEMAQGAEDGRDSGEFPRSVVWTVGELEGQVMRSPAEIALIQEAQQAYASDEVDVPHNARVTEADGGAWVEAWVWIARPEEKGVPVVPAPQVALALDLSEGGHCD